jgi:hypothetical protein
MLEKLQEIESRNKQKNSSSAPTVGSNPRSPNNPSSPQLVTVRGVVRDARNGSPIAGARVGLLVFGSQLDAGNIITWGGTNADGQFQLEKPVPAGRYTLRAKVIGDFNYAPYSAEVEIKLDAPSLMIGLKLAREQ